MSWLTETVERMKKEVAAAEDDLESRRKSLAAMEDLLATYPEEIK